MVNVIGIPMKKIVLPSSLTKLHLLILLKCLVPTRDHNLRLPVQYCRENAKCVPSGFIGVYVIN